MNLGAKLSQEAGSQPGGGPGNWKANNKQHLNILAPYENKFNTEIIASETIKGRFFSPQNYIRIYLKFIYKRFH